LRQLGQALKDDVDLMTEFTKDPLKMIQQFEQQPINDKWVYRLVVAALGLTISIRNDATVPTIFTALGSAAIGALAGLLAPAPEND
jgi:ribosomal protein S19E (S16A)